jgi:predicted AAA+ superfamily ATPase
MVKREFWQKRIEEAWSERPIVWLTGVRRVGKTTLARSLPDVRYFDCELPRTRRLIEEDVEGFLSGQESGRLVLDEVHRLENPSEVLKIAADHYPGLRILATGSSTLGASGRFRDTLAGRKRSLHLPPVLFSELQDFEVRDLRRRLLFGGLPQNLAAEHFPEKDFAEWIDAFWARDIQEMFRLERRSAFVRLLELLLAQSGSLCELTGMAAPCGASRQTLANYLKVLEETGAVHVLRPYAKNPQREITAMPKVYGFDTGFVCYARGWREVRPEDLGLLWEHLVLDELGARFGMGEIQYWRDKQKHEVDFVVARRGRRPVAVECKWTIKSASDINFRSFAAIHPDAALVVVATDAGAPRVHRGRGWVETGLGNIEEALEMAAELSR